MEFKVNRNSFLKIMQTVIIITGREINNQNNPQFKIEADSKENKITIICTNNESNFKKEIKVAVKKYRLDKYLYFLLFHFLNILI